MRKAFYTAVSAAITALVCFALAACGTTVEPGSRTTEDVGAPAGTAVGTVTPAPAATAVGEPDEIGDVAVDSVTVDDYGFVKVALTITNRSSKASSSYGLVDLYSAGNPSLTLTQAAFSTSALQPGGSAKAEAMGVITDAPADLAARVASVDRYQS